MYKSRYAIEINKASANSHFHQHFVFHLLLVIFLLSILGSRYTFMAYRLPESYSQLFTIIKYLIFAFLILKKIISDVLGRRITMLMFMLYAFAVYCILLIMVRLISGENVNDSIYFFLVLVGSACAVSSTYRGVQRSLFTWDIIAEDVVNFGYVVVAFQILYALVLSKNFILNPVNANIACCMLLAFIPCAILCYLTKPNKKKYSVAVFLFASAIVFSGSRAALLLLVLELAFIYFQFLRHNYKVAKIIIYLFVVAFLLAFIISINLWDIQYYIFRALGSFLKTTGNSTVRLEALAQIKRSDTLRKDLHELAINEFLKSPLFGTGQSYFVQVIPGIGTYKQSAHNFILETLDSFGIIGLLMLSISFLIACKNRLNNTARPYLIMSSLIFLAYSWVQPLLYDPLALLTFGMSIMACTTIGDSHPFTLYSRQGYFAAKD